MQATGSAIKLCSWASVDHCRSFLKDANRDRLAQLFVDRFEERYLSPILDGPPSQRNGFSMMAICCLMIEAVQQFKEGLTKTPRRQGRAMFVRFLAQHIEFADLEPYSSEFYEHVRCGILHQAETSGGWRILRKGRLFDSSTRTINATAYAKALRIIVHQYHQRLLLEQWDSEFWVNLRRKLLHICANAVDKTTKSK